MAKRCELTGVGPLNGNTVSHANNHTRRRWLPNLKKKRIFFADENRWVTVRLTASALKTLSKKGMGSVEKMRARVVRNGAHS
jgi:large subunit ribosomal protein L28